ncbi:hypothetical protein GCM10009780_42410 [Actinomadura alba]
MALTHATVHPTGCVLHVAGALRREDMTEERWSALQDAWRGRHHQRLRRPEQGPEPGQGPGQELPDALRRFGVRFPDGAKATTIEQLPGDGPRPVGPILAESHGGSGGRSNRRSRFHQDLWLWPLPPAVPFEFAVEWPLAGIPLTIIELDGAEITTAALNSTPFWPEDRPEA